MTKKEIKLGQKVKDIVSGVTGIAVSRCEYLNGCVQYGVCPKIKLGKESESKDMYIDCEVLEVIDDGILKKKKITKTGGPKHHPTGIGKAKL